MSKNKVSYVSLGCKVNLYESISVVNEFLNNDFELVEFGEPCDVCIINTCTVTQTSDAKSRKMIREAIKYSPKAVICVMGCYAQLNGEEVESIPGVSVVVGTSNRRLLFSYAYERLINSNKGELVNQISRFEDIKDYEELKVNDFTDKTRAFVKIQDGCENFCSYCAIPYARGAFRSRKKENIIKEIQNLSNNGKKEIVLTGINTGAYGLDLEDYSFPRLLEDIVAEVSNLGRIRISSIEVTEVTDELLEVIKNNQKHFCNHLHIPLQAGSDEILAKMNRKYDTIKYLETIERVRNAIPFVNITTDLLVGFDDEDNDLFNKAYWLIHNIGFGETHVFPYSPRKNTKAYEISKAKNYSNRVDQVTLKYRVNQLIRLNSSNGLKYRMRFVGKELEVLVETIKNGICIGHTSNYLEVSFAQNKAVVNSFVKVKIVKAGYPVSEGVEVDV